VSKITDETAGTHERSNAAESVVADDEESDITAATNEEDLRSEAEHQIDSVTHESITIKVAESLTFAAKVISDLELLQTINSPKARNAESVSNATDIYLVDTGDETIAVDNMPHATEGAEEVESIFTEHLSEKPNELPSKDSGVSGGTAVERVALNNDQDEDALTLEEKYVAPEAESMAQKNSTSGDETGLSFVAEKDVGKSTEQVAATDVTCSLSDDEQLIEVSKPLKRSSTFDVRMNSSEVNFRSMVDLTTSLAKAAEESGATASLPTASLNESAPGDAIGAIHVTFMNDSTIAEHVIAANLDLDVPQT
jgi:hypothetical protein